MQPCTASLGAALRQASRMERAHTRMGRACTVIFIPLRETHPLGCEAESDIRELAMHLTHSRGYVSIPCISFGFCFATSGRERVFQALGPHCTTVLSGPRAFWCLLVPPTAIPKGTEVTDVGSCGALTVKESVCQGVGHKVQVQPSKFNPSFQMMHAGGGVAQRCSLEGKARRAHAHARKALAWQFTTHGAAAEGRRRRGGRPTQLMHGRSCSRGVTLTMHHACIAHTHGARARMACMARFARFTHQVDA
jgi:hypothetical protein